MEYNVTLETEGPPRPGEDLVELSEQLLGPLQAAAPLLAGAAVFTKDRGIGATVTVTAPTKDRAVAMALVPFVMALGIIEYDSWGWLHARAFTDAEEEEWPAASSQ